MRHYSSERSKYPMKDLGQRIEMSYGKIRGTFCYDWQKPGGRNRLDITGNLLEKATGNPNDIPSYQGSLVDATVSCPQQADRPQ